MVIRSLALHSRLGATRSRNGFVETARDGQFHRLDPEKSKYHENDSNDQIPTNFYLAFFVQEKRERERDGNEKSVEKSRPFTFLPVETN